MATEEFIVTVLLQYEW